jgi:hypothetical protein
VGIGGGAEPPCGELPTGSTPSSPQRFAELDDGEGHEADVDHERRVPEFACGWKSRLRRSVGLTRAREYQGAERRKNYQT